jgi:hypothetical protein
MLYSNIRPLMATGDVILWKGDRIISKIIRYFGDYSHASLVVRSDDPDEADVVRIVEASRLGTKYRRLSTALCAEHGKAYWIPMQCTKVQRRTIKLRANEIEDKDTKYDYISTLLAPFKQIILDCTAYANCSELAWFLLRIADRVKAVVNKNNVEIAPKPGEMPADKWLGNNGKCMKPVKIEGMGSV